MPAQAAQLDAAVEDFVGLLSQLNRELNGLRPSVATVGAADVPRSVVYAVAEAARLLRECACRSRQNSELHATAKQAAWSVDTAWLAVLSGDIDDLSQHLADERSVRLGPNP
jgi:hypothetical protein